MSKSYTEVQIKRDSFDAEMISALGVTPWPVRIAEARRDGRFSDEDEEAAGHWVTCACGQQDAEIPRDLTGAPLDPVLDKLGIEFYNAINSDDFDGAERVLALIQARAGQVLAEIRGQS